MKFNLLILVFLISTNIFAFDKDLKTVNDRTTLEFNLLFEAMKLEAKTPSDRIKFVGLCKELDENLGFLSKDQIFLLMKSVVIKELLEYKFTKVRQYDMTTLLIDRLESGFTQKERFLNGFSKWIWRSVLAELKSREKSGIITTRSFNPRTFEGDKMTEALRFQKYLTYLSPWVDKMDSLSAPEFNTLVKEVSWVILRRLNERSLLFKRYASTASGDTKITLINIPQKLLDLRPEDIKRMQNDEPDMTLKEQSEKEKSRAQETVEKVTPEDFSPLSDDLNRELQKKTNEDLR